MGLGGLGACGSAVVPCCGVWVALELFCLATLLCLELEGSREGILYDEIDIMRLEKLLMLLTSSFIQWHNYKWWCHLATTCMTEI